MFVDARTLPQGQMVQADVCIIGAGAAGITLARDLADGKLKIAVMESGDVEYDHDTQNLYAGEVVGVAYTPLDRDRLRYLGGSTNHWEGSCRQLDEFDLEDWPIKREELESHYRRAHQICQLGPYSFNPADFSTPDAPALQLGPEASLKSGLFQYSPPTRFGKVYRQDLERAADVAVYLNANVVAIDTNSDASVVMGLQVACLNGKRFRVNASRYVLAAGGIENARLLLNSTRVQATGLGNDNDLVGRYFMDHADVPGAATVVWLGSGQENRFYDHHVVRDQQIEGYFCASDATRRRELLPPFAIGLRPASDAHAAGVGNIQLPTSIRSMLSDSVANAITYKLPRWIDRIESPYVWVHERLWPTPPNLFTTVYTCGPAPDPQSRVTLSDKVDALGLRTSRLDWHLPKDFERSMQRAHELLGQELGRLGVARLRIESPATTGADPMKDLDEGNHHMGTTRMHNDPRQGVVDANSKIHGIANLYVAGSSVFPSYGCDDPTLTIVALALRLSAHLRGLSNHA
jgi:choline dehydrogenase-like flavoprotein